MSPAWIVITAALVAGLICLAWACTFVLLQIQVVWNERAEAALKHRQIKARAIDNEREIVEKDTRLQAAQQENARIRNTKLTDEVKQRDRVIKDLNAEIARLNEDMRKMRMGMPEAPKVDLDEIARVVVEKLKGESLLPVSVDPAAIAAEVSDRIDAELTGLKKQVTDVTNLVASSATADTTASDQITLMVGGLESQVVALREHLVAEGDASKATLQEMRGSLASLEQANVPVDGPALVQEVTTAVENSLESFRMSLDKTRWRLRSPQLAVHHRSERG